MLTKLPAFQPCTVYTNDYDDKKSDEIYNGTLMGRGAERNIRWPKTRDEDKRKKAYSHT